MDNELQDRIRMAGMKERHKNKLIPWYKKWWGIMILIILALTISLVTMAGIYVYQSVTRINADRAALYSGKRPDLIKLLVEGENRPYLGNPKADIIIVQFSDFACPYCKENQPAIKAIMSKYGNQVKMIFRNLILHTDSEELALAALCAGEQQNKGGSLFWPMHDRLFDLQGKINNGDLPKIAASLGADEKIFSTCLTSKKYLGVLSSDMEVANTLQITGSPTWFVNNYKVDGLISQEELESMIQELIKNGPGVETASPAASSTSAN
ncbi:MAG: DsbA family protein [Candidatus Falkowbacteria bacterium]|nr:DsbA family protein [Candidatus Falkowbacteria bacterium]